MIMDGVLIEVGMLVYHLQFGTGTVISVHREGQMSVRYGRGIIPATQADISMGLDKGRMVFWRNPIMLAPPADDTAWNALKTLIDSSRSVVTIITGVTV